MKTAKIVVCWKQHDNRIFFIKHLIPEIQDNYSMLHSTCPSERLNGTTGIAPRTLEDLMKRCTLLKPKLDSHYFREIGDNPFHSLFRGTNQDIILTKYAPHESNSPSSLYQPPPSAHTGLSSQLSSQDDGTELWDGVVPGTQNENPPLSMGPPSEDTPTAEESQSVRNKYKSLLLLMSSDSEQSDGDTIDLVFTEREENLQQIQECEDGVRESLTQAFALNESIHNIEKSPPLPIRTAEQTISTNKLPENQQTQDSDSFFASLDTILFQYTEQIQSQSQTQTKTSPIIIQDESPLVSMEPSGSIHSREIIESQTYTKTEEYSSEYEYSGSESDGDSLMTSFAETESQSINTNEVSPHNSANSNLITGGNITNLHTEYNANRTSPNFKPKRIKLTITPDDKMRQHYIQKGITDVFRKPCPVHCKQWTRQEEQLLVIGVNKFGKSWKKIHTDFNFSPSRTVRALARKYESLAMNGKYSKHLSEFHKKAGYKSHDTSPRESYSNMLKNQAKEQREKWTYQEMENLVIGVERYGPDWEKIHNSFDFSPSRSYFALYRKHSRMMICGEYNKILLTYGKKVAKTIPAASQPKLNLGTVDKISSAISGEITANNGLIEDLAKSKESKLHNKFLKHEELSKIKWTRDEVNNLIRGYEQYGNSWSAILVKYTFNPCRTARSLGEKFHKMSKGSGDIFFNDKQDPYFLPS